MPLTSSEKPSKSGAFKSFWFKLLDLPEDDQFQRLINSQLISAPSPSTSASQTQLRHQQQQQQLQTTQFGSTTSRFAKTTDHPAKSTGEQVQFASSNQNSVYCVSSVSLGRLAYEEQQSAAGRAGSSAGGAPLGSVQSTGLMQQPPPAPQGLPTPTQLTIATELPTATKFTTRPASFADKPRPTMHSMHKRGEHLFIYWFHLFVNSKFLKRGKENWFVAETYT